MDLATQLERLYAAEPGLRHRAEMHDYQLTYPPAVTVEVPEHAGTPRREDYLPALRGDLVNTAFYFHFGFCAYRCRYCWHYELRVTRDEALMERYVEALLAETRRLCLPEIRQRLVFCGGGTPTALPPRLIARFLQGMRDTIGPPGTRLSTVEAKPVTATAERLRPYVEAGFRRINLGVQTLDPALYAHHHHGEELSVALTAIDRARACGFTQVNIDILTGLHTQTPASWDRTLRTLESLATSGAVDSVFIYPYHDDPRSQTYGRPDALPSFAETADSEHRARAMFQRLGWMELGPRFFRSRRHVLHEVAELARAPMNPAYGEFLYLGIGNSAFTVGDHAAAVNRRDAVAYCEQVERGELGVSHWTRLDRFQRATRDLTFDVLYSPVVRVRSLQRKYGPDALDAALPHLHRWTELGLGTWNTLIGTWRLTGLGKLVHLQMLPALYLRRDREPFDRVMERRRGLRKRYRGY